MGFRKSLTGILGTALFTGALVFSGCESSPSYSGSAQGELFLDSSGRQRVRVPLGDSPFEVESHFCDLDGSPYTFLSMTLKPEYASVLKRNFVRMRVTSSLGKEHIIDLDNPANLHGVSFDDEVPGHVDNISYLVEGRTFLDSVENLYKGEIVHKLER